MFKKRFTISLFQKYQNYLQRKRSLKIRQYASDDLLIDWRTIYSFPWMNALFTLNLVSFSIKFWTEFYPSMISLSKIGKCESTPLCTFCLSIKENMHPFFYVSLLYKISGIQFNCFLEVIYFPKSMYSSVSVSHLKIRFFIITLSYSRNSTFTLTPGFKPFTFHSTFTVVILRILIRQELCFWQKWKQFFQRSIE